MTCQMVFFALQDFADVTALTLPASASILPLVWRDKWCDGARQML